MNTVISKDGSRIAYVKSGSGPAFILIDGAFCSKDFGPAKKLAPQLAQHFTVFAYDRRARGDSGDNQPYAIEREIEDIAALIDKVGGSASIFAISSGAILALKAAASGLNIEKLALLEPPFVGNKNGARAIDAFQQLKHLVDSGRKEEACKFYLRKVIGLPAIVPFVLSFTRDWAKMKANANSLPYDAALCGDFSIPKELLKNVTTPSLVIASSKSPKTLQLPAKEVAELLPGGSFLTLKGKVHDVPPEILVPALVDFYGHSSSVPISSNPI